MSKFVLSTRFSKKFYRMPHELIEKMKRGSCNANSDLLLFKARLYVPVVDSDRRQLWANVLKANLLCYKRLILIAFLHLTGRAGRTSQPFNKLKAATAI